MKGESITFADKLLLKIANGENVPPNINLGLYSDKEQDFINKKLNDSPKVKKKSRVYDFEMIKNDEVEMIIIYKFDRLTRSMVDLVNFIELCGKNNVSLISVHENLDMSTPIGRMQANMIGALAQFEREQISIRTIDGLQEKASQGQYPLGNKVPYGYKKDKNHKIYQVDEQVKIIKELLKYYAYDNLSEYVASEIIYNKYNKYFSPKNVKSYLSKDLFKGFVQVGGKDFYIVEPIFTVQDIEALERRRELPNFKIANATIHFDESTPHLHIVGIPIKEECSRGLSTQISKSSVFTREGMSELQKTMKNHLAEELEYDISDNCSNCNAV